MDYRSKQHPHPCSKAGWGGRELVRWPPSSKAGCGETDQWVVAKTSPVEELSGQWVVGNELSPVSPFDQLSLSISCQLMSCQRSDLRPLLINYFYGVGLVLNISSRSVNSIIKYTTFSQGQADRQTHIFDILCIYGWVNNFIPFWYLCSLCLWQINIFNIAGPTVKNRCCSHYVLCFESSKLWTIIYFTLS